MKTYPICLSDLCQQRVIVAGGGRVALRKVRGLLAAGAFITLISPEIDETLLDLAQTESLTLERRAYQLGDLRGAFLVIAATDDPQVNQAIWQEARSERCLINVVDDPAHSNFILPAVVRQGEFSIAISTGGASPALARHVRERLETEFGPEYGELTQLLGELRSVLLCTFPTGEERLNAALKLIDADLIEILKQTGYSQAKQYALSIIKPDCDDE